MTEREPRPFDAFGDDYHERLDRCLHSLGGRDSRYYNRLKAGWILRLSQKYLGPTAGKDFLDLGCGTGLTEEAIAKCFRSGVGLDASPGMLKAAGESPPCAFALGDAGRLPFADRSFDLVFSVTLLHHLGDDDLHRMMREAKRVLRPGGLTAHFDHNPYNFLTRKVAKYCEFDRDQEVILRPKRKIVRLVQAEGFRVLESGYLAFIPAAVKFLEPLETWFKPLPLGGQYFVAARG